jgi:hypothetical protein
MRPLRAFVTGAVLFAFVLVGVLGIAWAVSAEYQNAPETNYTVTGEEVIADVGNTSTVDAPDYALRFWDNETVYDSDGNVLVEGSDYEWNATTGTITWLSSTTYSDGETMTVDYAFVGKTEQARTLRTVLSVPVEIVLPAGVLVVVAMAVAGLGAGVYALFGGRSQRRGGLDFSRR